MQTPMDKQKHHKYSESKSKMDCLIVGKMDMSEEVYWECGPVKEEMVPWVSEGVRGLPYIAGSQLT
jgi:hypothetical protein